MKPKLNTMSSQGLRAALRICGLRKVPVEAVLMAERQFQTLPQWIGQCCHLPVSIRFASCLDLELFGSHDSIQYI